MWSTLELDNISFDLGVYRSRGVVTRRQVALSCGLCLS